MGLPEDGEIADLSRAAIKCKCHSTVYRLSYEQNKEANHDIFWEKVSAFCAGKTAQMTAAAAGPPVISAPQLLSSQLPANSI